MPDGRGYFIRGLDKGAGRDPSRALGSIQASQNKKHNHPVNDPTHPHAVHTHQVHDNSGGGQSGQAGPNNPGPPGTTTTASATGISIQAAATGITVDNDTDGGTESRPVNIAFNVIIKY